MTNFKKNEESRCVNVRKTIPRWNRKLCNFADVAEKYSKLANFARLYFPHFRKFRAETWQFY